jgi:hypothetical protein
MLGDETTLAEELKSAGYVSFCFGNLRRAISHTSCPFIVSETANSGTSVMPKTCPQIHLKAICRHGSTQTRR